VNFIDEGTRQVPTDPTVAPYRAADWARVDSMLDAFRTNGLKAILDLSAYRNCVQNWLVAHGSTVTPYSYDWSTFVRFVAKRVNTMLGLTNLLAPTISFITLTRGNTTKHIYETL